MRILPLTRERWNDVALLFKTAPASGCWCMYFRRTTKEFRGAGNRERFRALVDAGREPGLVAYLDGEPVGWCSVAPRGEYPYLQVSKALYPVDDTPVWSIVCFVVRPEDRGRGVATALLKAAVRYAKAHGAKVVEGYPSDPGTKRRLAEISAYTGVISMFESAGFQRIVQRRKGGRTIMRIYLR